MLPYHYHHHREGVATLNLSATQPRLVEPLTLAEVKQYLRVDYPDDDVLIGTLISAAREQAEYLQGRVLVRKSYDLTYEGAWPWDGIVLASPVTSVDLVQTTAYDGMVTTVAAATPATSGYVADLTRQPATLHMHGAYPGHSLLIRFTAGYAPTDPYWNHAGARLKAGMLLLISAWYGNRIPFAGHVTSASEYPFAVTHCLTAGALRRVR